MHIGQVKRREFIACLGGMALYPLAARAQQREKVRRIGVIMGFAEDDEVWQAYLATFRQRLQDFGWSEGRNIRFDYWFTGESTERMRVAASEVVAMAPDLIFVSTNPVVSALRDVNRTIPAVFTWVSEPVGSGYVTSLAHPGGNITGFQNYEPALGAKMDGYSQGNRACDTPRRLRARSRNHPERCVHACRRSVLRRTRDNRLRGECAQCRRHRA
jgi:putative ABC transport system substrate-binding protein